jgi:hypothetical protein
LNIPIGGITEINPKGFTLEIEVDFLNLSLYVKNNSYILGRSIATLEANVVVIKYCYFDEIHIVESK